MTDQGSTTPQDPRTGAAGSTDGESALDGISRPAGSAPARAETDEPDPRDDASSRSAREPGRPADVEPGTASGSRSRGPAGEGTPDGDSTPEAATQSRAAEMAQEDLLRRTRASVWYAGLVVAAILLILLMVFIAQNSEKVTIHFLGLSGQISLAIALVVATVVGVLLVAIPGGARMYQLRKRVKGLRKAVLDD